MENGTTNTLVGLITAGLMYTAMGLGAALIYMAVAPALGLPAVGLLPLLGVWWLWFLIWAPPVVFLVSTFRATDPLKQLVDGQKRTQEQKNNP